MQIKDDSYHEIKPHIDYGETLLWAGKPQQGHKLRTADKYMIPFSFMWGGFAFIWEWRIFTIGAPLILQLFAMIFVLAGLYLIAGRFFIDKKRREKTVYGITNSKVIIKTGLFSQPVKFLDIHSLSLINYDEKDDGSGSIIFGKTDTITELYRGIIWPGANELLPPAIEMIENVRLVYIKIIELQKEKS